MRHKTTSFFLVISFLASSMAPADEFDDYFKKTRKHDLLFLSLDTASAMRRSLQHSERSLQKSAKKSPHSVQSLPSEEALDSEAKQLLKDQLNDLIEEAHHSMEGEVENHEENKQRRNLKSLAKEWVANFNLHEFALNSYRWLQMKQADPKYREHTLNLVYLLGASHALETLSGPIGVAVANHAGVSNTGLALIGSVGAIISIPGLDPLCLVLMSFYKTSQGFQKVTTKVRLLSSKSAALLFRYIQVPLFLDLFFDEQNPAQRLRVFAAKNGYDYNRNQLKISVFTNHDLVLSFIESEKQIYLAEVSWSESFVQNTKENPQQLEKTLRDFKALGYVFQHSLKQLLKVQLPSDAKEFFYIDKKADERRIQIKDFAMTITSKRKLNGSGGSTLLCESIFN